MKNLILTLAACAVIAGLSITLLGSRLIPASDGQTADGGESPVTTGAETGLVTTPAVDISTTAMGDMLTTPAADISATAVTAWLTTAAYTDTTEIGTTAVTGLFTTDFTTVSEITSTQEVTPPTFAERFAGLGIPGLTDNDLIYLENCFNTAVQRYEESYKSLYAWRGDMAGVNIVNPEALAAAAQYSPLAYLMNTHAAEIRSNPVLLARKLVRPTFVGVEKPVAVPCDMAGTARAPFAYSTPAECVNTVLGAMFGEGNYTAGMDSDGLWYAYIATADSTGIHIAALYFRFDATSSVLTGAGADMITYTGKELLVFNGGNALGTGDAVESPLFAAIRDRLYAALGSAPSALLLNGGGTVRTEASYIKDLSAEQGNSAKGLFNSVWMNLG